MAAMLRCAVLVQVPDPVTDEAGWRVIYVDGNEAGARKFAERWCIQHPGEEAWVMVTMPDNPCRADLQTQWGNNRTSTPMLTLIETGEATAG